MKHIYKRALSGALALTMALSAAPVTFAAATDDVQSTVADWKFGEDYTTGSINDGSLVIEDQSGNGNNLEMQFYANKWLTETAPSEAILTSALSFSDDTMDSSSDGSLVFDGAYDGNGADFVTIEGAGINSNEFEDGYTIEFIYQFPEDWTTKDSWMGMLSRQAYEEATASTMDEAEMGSTSMAVSSCKEIQFVTANADDDHKMSSAAWSITMDNGGEWYHIAVVSDGNEISTYVNGCEAFRDYVSSDMVGLFADPDDGRFRIGSAWWMNGTTQDNGSVLDKFLQGSIQEVRISDTALEQSEWLVPDATQYMDGYGSNDTYELIDEDNYTIILLPDTQNTVEYVSDVMDTAIDGIISSADELKTIGVVHLGDVVDNANETQYADAVDAFYRLPSEVNFLIQPGNHDDATLYNSHFSSSCTDYMTATADYLTANPAANGRSSYMLVKGNDYEYLIISLATNGYSTSWSAAEQTWFEGVLAEYPNTPTIVTSHDLQTCSDTEPSSIKLDGNGQKMWNIIKDQDQVFMMVGGHNHGSGVEILTNDNGKEVISVLTDLQFGYNGGNGYFRYLEFSEGTDEIYYSIYSPYAASLSDEEKSFFDTNYLNGAGHEGTIDLDFSERFEGMEIERHLEIQQVYGSKDDGTVSHGFIELYNPTLEDIDLTGKTLQYRSSVDGANSEAWEVLELTGTIASKDYFVVRCGAIDEGEIPDFYISDADQEWDLQLHSKGVSVALVNSTDTTTVEGALTEAELSAANIIDLAAAAGNDYPDETEQAPYAYESADDSVWSDEIEGVQSKKKAIYRTEDTGNSQADFVANEYEGTLDEDMKVHATISDEDPNAEPAPAITEYDAIEVETATGFENGTYGGLDVELVSRFDTNFTEAELKGFDGGVVEIVTYNTKAEVAYVVAGSVGELIVVPMDTVSLDGLAGTGYNMEIMLEDADMGDFAYGDMSSVAVNADGTLLAVALQEADYTKTGLVAIFELNEDGTLAENPTFVECGVQPDALTFTPDGTKILVANEGEPRMGYGDGAVDPEGSVTIIDTATKTATQLTFDEVTTDENVLIKTGATNSEDFEPEYIAATNETAYVALQENNAIAVLDLSSKSFTGVYGLGLQDFTQVAVDMQKDDNINITTQDNVYGIRMPDGISLATIGGTDYLFTANEGDGREWGSGDTEYCNENKSTTSFNGTEYEEKVTWFNPADYDMLDQTKDYLFGTRSFSIFEVTDAGLELVFDSESDFETKTAEYVADNFNCSNDDISLEDRSGKKGVEPEYAMVGEVDGEVYAFIGLERLGGIMVYNVSDPANAEYVNYINTRDYSADVAGDVAPEGMSFITAENSPTGNALLLTANEVSGTMPVFELTTTDYDLEIAVLSDPHLYDAEALGSSGTAWEAYLAGDRKMLAESEAILAAAIANIKEQNPDVLLIPGDLTKDGEKVNHELMAEMLAELETAGTEVYVIPGNHDISNAHAVSFDGDTATQVETVDTEDFTSIYADFGYEQAVATDENSLSYAVDMGDDYRLIAIDSAIYNNDKAEPEQKTAGKIDDTKLAWVIEQIEDAIEDGRQPIGMLHHGLVPHTAIQPDMFGEYLVEDYEAVTAALLDAGMSMAFTGHFHSQDIASVEIEGKTFTDIETGSLVTAPSPIRYVGLNGDEVTVATETIDEVEGVPNFVEYSNTFLVDGLNGLVPYMLAGALGVDIDEANGVANTEITAGLTVKNLIVNSMIAHYAGDEDITPYAQIIGTLMASPDATYQLLGTVCGALLTDSATADLAASFTLNELPEISSGGTSKPSVNPNADADDTNEEESTTSSFIDVSANDWFYDVVTYVVENNLFNGVSDTEFAPNSNMTRNMFFTVLHRMSGDKLFTGGETWSTDGMNWAVANGISDGTAGDDNITREQMATMLYRYAKLIGMDTSKSADLTTFADGDSVSDYAKEAMSWAVSIGLVKGYENNTLMPQNNATRAEVAAIIARFCEL